MKFLYVFSTVHPRLTPSALSGICFDVEALQYLQEHRLASYREIIDNPKSGQLSAIKEYAKRLGRSQPAA